MKFILSTIFACALLVVGACSNSNGVSQAEQPNQYQTEILVKDSSNVPLYRTVDCDAGVVIYHKYQSTAAVPFNVIHTSFINKHCH